MEIHTIPLLSLKTTKLCPNILSSLKNLNVSNTHMSCLHYYMDNFGHDQNLLLLVVQKDVDE
jgi:hypothetical protein